MKNKERELKVKSFFDGKIVDKSYESFMRGICIGLFVGFIVCGIIYEVYLK